jgi:hypothetical protein
MRQLTFTNLLIQHLIDDAETPQTVLEWLRTASDPKEREKGFAQQLAEDFRAANSVTDDEADPELILKDNLLGLVCMKTNWRRVARAVLRYFTIPVTMANLASGETSPNRLAHLLAAGPRPWN